MWIGFSYVRFLSPYFLSKLNFIALFTSIKSSVFALSTLFSTAILFMCLYITEFQVNHSYVVRVLQDGVFNLKSLCKYIVHLIRLDATTHRHWPVSAMVRTGLSKCETVSSNRNADNDVVVGHNIRHLIIVC